MWLFFVFLYLRLVVEAIVEYKAKAKKPEQFYFDPKTYFIAIVVQLEKGYKNKVKKGSILHLLGWKS